MTQVLHGVEVNKDKIVLHLCVENYHPPKGVYGIIANPVCTHFSIARTVAKTPRDLREGMRLIKECLRIVWECQYDTPESQRVGSLKFWM